MYTYIYYIYIHAYIRMNAKVTEWRQRPKHMEKGELRLELHLIERLSPRLM